MSAETNSPPPVLPASPSMKVTRPLRFTIGLLALLTAMVPLATAVVLLFNVNSETVRDDARRLHTAVAQRRGPRRR